METTVRAAPFLVLEFFGGKFAVFWSKNLNSQYRNWTVIDVYFFNRSMPIEHTHIAAIENAVVPRLQFRTAFENTVNVEQVLRCCCCCCLTKWGPLLYKTDDSLVLKELMANIYS